LPEFDRAVITQTAAEPTVGRERKTMSQSSDLRSLEVRSKVTSQGKLELWLDEFGVSEPLPGELVVRIDAAPVNPSDIILMLGPADLSTIRVEPSATRPTVSASIPPSRLAGVAHRLDQAVPVGNEGAGVVVGAGRGAEDMVGRTVAFRCALGTYAQYRTMARSECMILPEGFDPKQAASAFINPLTALGMVETMRREGHRALVHTAAASNVGQMLNRLCLKDGVDLVNIVRSKEQADLVHRLGAKHVIDSSSENFEEELTAALEQTDATLAFDAVGGGALASQILIAMERAQLRKQTGYSRYGSATHKQVYIYGVLDSGANADREGRRHRLGRRRLADDVVLPEDRSRGDPASARPDLRGADRDLRHSRTIAERSARSRDDHILHQAGDRAKIPAEAECDLSAWRLRHRPTTAADTKTALLPAPFWCTERVDRTHFDWR
jgi:NADPH:quinone reductase-like Zn-dependent oxidoreductase